MLGFELGRPPVPAPDGDLLRSRRILERERYILLTSGTVFSQAPSTDKDGLESIGGPCLMFVGPHRLSAVQFYATPMGGSISNGIATGTGTGVGLGAGGDGSTPGNAVVRRSSISILQKFLLSAGATSPAAEANEPTSAAPGEGNETGGSSNGSFVPSTDKLIKELLSKNPTLSTLMSSTAASATATTTTTTTTTITTTSSTTANLMHSVRKPSTTRTRSLYFSIEDSQDLWVFPTTAVIEPRADDVMVKFTIPPGREDKASLGTSNCLTMIIMGASPALISLLQLITMDPLLVSSFTDFIPRLHSPPSLPNVPFEELASPPFVPPRILSIDLQCVLPVPPPIMKRFTGTTTTTNTAVVTTGADSRAGGKTRKRTMTKSTREEITITGMVAHPPMSNIVDSTVIRPTGLTENATSAAASGTEANISTTAAGASRPATIPSIAPIKKRKYLTTASTTVTSVSHPTRGDSVPSGPKIPP